MLFFRYLLERRRVIAASLLLGAGAWYLFRLYGLPQSPLLYCFLLIATVGWGLFGLPDFVSFYRRLRQAQALRRAAPHLTEPVDAGGWSQPLGDRLMAETVEELRQRIAGLETQLAGRQEELLEYFTLWAHQIKTPLAAMELFGYGAGVPTNLLHERGPAADPVPGAPHCGPGGQKVRDAIHL